MHVRNGTTYPMKWAAHSLGIVVKDRKVEGGGAK